LISSADPNDFMTNPDDFMTTTPTSPLTTTTVIAPQVLTHARYSGLPHDLVGKTAHDLERILGHRSNGFEMFLSSDVELFPGTTTGYMSTVPEDQPTESEFKFCRVRVDIPFLLRVGRTQSFLRENDCGGMWDNVRPAPHDIADGCGANDAGLTWQIQSTATSVWFTAKRADGAVAFMSISFQPRCLLNQLDVTLGEGRDAEELDYLAEFVRPVGPYLLLSDTDESFVDVVAAKVPEVAAELSAAAMRAKVSESLACADTGADASAAAPPRRRRMGA
jgi:hypothetical protein